MWWPASASNTSRMLDKQFLQSFLKLNNASEQMSDADVRGVLSGAGWTESEAEAAIALLRSDAQNAQSLFASQSATLGGTSFRPGSDEVSSSQISSLLGVDVEIDPRRLRQHAALANPQALHHTLVRTMIGSAIVVFSMGLAAMVGMGFFFFLEIGPFRP
jgi:hypothetical protein